MPKLDHILQDLALHVASTFNTWLTRYEEIESRSPTSRVPLNPWPEPTFLKASKVKAMQVWGKHPSWCTAVVTARGLAVPGCPSQRGARGEDIQALRWALTEVPRKPLSQPGDTHAPRSGTSVKVIPGPPNTAWLYLPLVARRWSHATWSTCARSILLVDRLFSRDSQEIFS